MRTFRVEIPVNKKSRRFRYQFVEMSSDYNRERISTTIENKIQDELIFDRSISENFNPKSDLPAKIRVVECDTSSKNLLKRGMKFFLNLRMITLYQNTSIQKDYYFYEASLWCREKKNVCV